MEDIKEILKDWITEEEFDKLFVNGILKNYVTKSELRTTPINSEKPEDNTIIFNAFDGLKPEEVKVLIIGQDPYPNPKRADGMAFSFKKALNPKDQESAKYALKKIFNKLKEIGIDNKNTNLSSWKDRGVLLLNTSLTYEEVKNKKDKTKEEIEKEKQALLNKHANAWRPFILKILTKLKMQKQRIVVMLWGQKAQDIWGNSDMQSFGTNIKILKSSHPQARKENNTFITNNHFADCDTFLGKDNKIDWSTYEITE